MKWICLALLTVMAAPVGAAVVTVTPVQEIAPVGETGLGEIECTDGWSIVTNAGGWGKLSAYGPSTYSSRNGPFFFQQWYDPQDAYHDDQALGRGAFYATCHWEKATAPRMMKDWTPSTVWLGTDKWNGQDVAGRTLGSITEMEYFSFVSTEPTDWEGGKSQQEWWAAESYWRGANQCIQIHLVITDPSHTMVRQLWYRPWGGNYVGNDGGLNEPGDDIGRWVVYYCLNMGKWYIPPYGAGPNEIERCFPTWDDDVLNFTFPEGNYGPLRNWELVSTSKSPGWPDQPLDDPNYPDITVIHTYPPGEINSTGTGKPINFFVGARVAEVERVRDENGDPIEHTGLFDQNEDMRWVNGSNGFRGQIDYFTLGFNGQSVTYDFEPAPDDPPAHILASSGRSLDVLRSPLMALTNPWNGNLYRVVGRIAPQPEGKVNQYFKIEDGSLLTYLDKGYRPDWINQVLPGPLRVYLPDDEFRLWMREGDLVMVTGFIEPLRFVWSEIETARIPSTPLMIWTNINNVVVNPQNQ